VQKDFLVEGFGKFAVRSPLEPNQAVPELRAWEAPERQAWEAPERQAWEPAWEAEEQAWDVDEPVE